jgi:hypothetical protein
MKSLLLVLLILTASAGFAQDQLRMENANDARALRLFAADKKAGLFVDYPDGLLHRPAGPPTRYEAAVLTYATIMNAHAALATSHGVWVEISPEVKALPWLIDYFARELKSLGADMIDLRAKAHQIISRVTAEVGATFADVFSYGREAARSWDRYMMLRSRHRRTTCDWCE